ncbi:MAG: ABC-F family ATP-binding cassette domain-containing protein [Acholeplasmatales bacterium]|nr:ABC-F family ATP-binding cassette domain-containing protein [Acholeplasmatales bacterium]
MNITFENVTFKYIERNILDNASFSITDSDKIGVVGVNGTGKTTLLKLILGIENPKSGNIIKSGGMRINYLMQDPVFDPNKSLFDIVMEESTKENPIPDYEASSILTKLGFMDHSITVKNFSGGQLKRLALAKVLVTPCDILILDEPTNHLDNALILWLEKYLIKWKKGLIMVTHDRYFLQRVCNKMMELDFGKVYIYDANYDLFLELKAKRLEEQATAEKKLKAILKTETEWMRAGVEARRTKSKSRIERFEKLSEIKFNEHKDMELTSITSYLGKKLISMVNGSKSYGKTLFKDFSFDLERNDIVGVVGDNGCGKSTLFRILMGIDHLDSGELILGETLKIGYFSQNLELIDPEIRVIDYIEEEASLIETLDGTINASTLLERFLFTKELQYSKVKMLSGGEKRRLQLIRVLSKNPNILLFDEPTNDLDLYTLEILEDYIESFKGPVLVISHDRYFLDKICNKLFIFKNGQIEQTLQSFTEYLNTEAVDDRISDAPKANKPRNANKMPAKERNLLASLENEIPTLEEKLKTLQDEIKQSSTDFHKLMEIQEEIDKLTIELSEKTDKYFELLEMKEEIEGR